MILYILEVEGATELKFAPFRYLEICLCMGSFFAKVKSPFLYTLALRLCCSDYVHYFIVVLRLLLLS